MSKLEQLEKWINKQQFEVSGKGHYIDAIPLLQKLSELKADEGEENKSLPLCTRVEVIDSKGRSYTNYSCKKVYTQMQDGNKTLKIFID
jgi:hypothetical protein